MPNRRTFPPQLLARARDRDRDRARDRDRDRSTPLGMMLARLSITVLGALLSVACSRPSGPGQAPTIEPPPQVSADGKAAARAFYVARCAECHGEGGQGDGPRAPTLRPRPQRLSDRIWQSNVSNARLQRAMLLGGAAVGKSEVMPAFPELRSQPETLAGLVAQLRSFAAP